MNLNSKGVVKAAVVVLLIAVFSGVSVELGKVGCSASAHLNFLGAAAAVQVADGVAPAPPPPPKPTSTSATQA